MRVAFCPVVMVVALATGCRGQEYEDYCDKVRSCGGGNDKDQNACVDTMEGEEDVADDYGCGDQFDKLVECLKKNAVCQAGVLVTTACKDQDVNYGDCTGASSGLHR
jgi:hypothetical protein